MASTTAHTTSNDTAAAALSAPADAAHAERLARTRRFGLPRRTDLTSTPLDAMPGPRRMAKEEAEGEGGERLPELADAVDTLGALAGPANVIMQLSWPEIGWGVRESTQVGNVYTSPLRRARTTFQYLAVAALGTDEEKRKYRREVTRIHTQVIPDSESPVEYSALDPKLQLWVAACLYIGFEDAFEWLHGTMTPEGREHFYQSAHVLGTVLQVTRDQWPESRAAFDDYWAEGKERIHFDPEVRTHLLGIAELRMLPQPATLLGGRLSRWITTGFLRAEFRDALAVRWTPTDQRRFGMFLRAVRATNDLLPEPLRAIAYRTLIWDLRWRLRTGRALM